MQVPVNHTNGGKTIGCDCIDFTRLPKLVVKDSVLKEWFSINKACYSSLQALKFRLLCLRAHYTKLGPVLPRNVYNGSTFDLNLTYEEYVSLFLNFKENESHGELLGDIMFLICELVDVKCSLASGSSWMTLLAIELFSTAYSLDDEKVYWYVAICKTNEDVDFKLPKSSVQKWVKQARALNLSSELDTTGSCHSLNPTNETLDFVIISILELLMSPDFDQFTSIFKSAEPDSTLFSKLRLPRKTKILNRCSQIWSGQHIAYRCITCGTSTSSCICVDCFQNGNHQGHDYYIYKSDYGGCCDCGDEQAWSKDGFCSKHQSGEDAQRCSSSSVTPDLERLRSNLRGLFQGILCHVVCLSRLYCTAPNTREIYLPFHSKLVSKIIEHCRGDERLDDTNFHILDFYVHDEDLSEGEEPNVSPENVNLDGTITDDEVGTSSNMDDISGTEVPMESNSREGSLEAANDMGETRSPPRRGRDRRSAFSLFPFLPVLPLLPASPAPPPLPVHPASASPQRDEVTPENIQFRQDLAMGGDHSMIEGDIPLMLLFKQEKNFQMDSYFFQWFISLCENYQSIFLSLLGEVFGYPVHDLLMFGVVDPADLGEDLKSKSKFVCNLLKPLVEEYISKRSNSSADHRIRSLLKAVHSGFGPGQRRDESGPRTADGDTDQTLSLESDEESVLGNSDFRIEALTYLDVFWMKWSRQLNEANESFIHQTIISKIYKQNDLTDLLLVMMFDSKFKEEIFPDIFIRNYNELVKRQDKVLTRIAVQLFTVDKMLVSMSLDSDLIRNIFYTTFQTIHNSVVYQKVSCETEITNHPVPEILIPIISPYNSAVVNKKYTYSMHDTKYFLQCVDFISFIFLNKYPDLVQEELSARNITFEESKSLSRKLYRQLWYNGWLSMLRLVQCINPHRSKVMEPSEDLKWHSSLLLCCDIQSTVDILLQTVSLLVLHPSTSSLAYQPWDHSQELTNHCIYRLVSDTVQSLIQWIHVISIKESWNVKYSHLDKDLCGRLVLPEQVPAKHGRYSLHNYSILKGQVSIHVPLNRTSTQLIYMYLDYVSRVSNGLLGFQRVSELLEDLGILNDLVKVLLMEHPLRAYCFVHQAFFLNNGSWLRNGLSPMNEARFYKKSHWSTMYILLDIFSIRFLLNLIKERDGVLFVVFSVLSHFNLLNDGRDLGDELGASGSNRKKADSGEAGKESKTDKDRLETSSTYFNVLPLRSALNKNVSCAVLLVMDIFNKITSLDIPVSLSFNKSIYRYLLTQYLIRKNRSRSEIQEGLPISSSSSLYYGSFIQSVKSSNINSIIDEILDSFCEKIPASDKKPIIYKIKQPLGWMLYDPLLPVRFVGVEDSSRGDSICYYFNSWTDSLSQERGVCKGEANSQDSTLKKRRIGETGAPEQNSTYSDCKPTDKSGRADAQEDADMAFIRGKFSKFPAKLCHVPRRDHFSRGIHFNSSQNLHIKSTLLSNLLQLALPKLLGVGLDQTLLEDMRIMHHSCILLFNLVNIEVMDQVYRALDARDDPGSRLKVAFNHISLSPREGEETSEMISRSIQDVSRLFFSVSSEKSGDDSSSLADKGSDSDSREEEVLDVLVYSLGREGENDDYQYFVVSPQLCSSIRGELSRRKTSLLHHPGQEGLAPIELSDLSMTHVCEELRKRGVSTVFEILTVPVILRLGDSGPAIQESFCLMDVLVEALYSLRVGDNEQHLKRSPEGFKFISREVLKAIPVESLFFLEWGLSIAKETSPEIESYLEDYLESLCRERRRSLSEEALDSKETGSGEKGALQEKQRNILREYMKKQKSFMSNFKQSMLLDSEEVGTDSRLRPEADGENAEFCVFCHEMIDSSDGKIATFGYLDLQNVSLDSKRVELSEATLDGLQHNFGYTSFYLTICGHLIHYRCISQYYKLFNNESLSNSSRASSVPVNHRESGGGDQTGGRRESGLEIQYLGFPLISQRNRVKLSVRQVGADGRSEEGSEGLSSTSTQSSSFLHVLSCQPNEPGESKLGKRSRQYDSSKQVYHLTNLTCPYCNTFSNLVLPFEYHKDPSKGEEDLGTETGREEQNLGVRRDDYLIQILDGLLDLQSKDEIGDLFDGEYEGINGSHHPLNNVEMAVGGIPILEQTLSILTLFSNLLPFNVPGVHFSINGVPSVNPFSFLIKLICDNIAIDSILGFENGRDSAGFAGSSSPYSSTRSLMYDIVFDSLKSIISKFPFVVVPMICNMFPILGDENKIDIWNYISLQSPTARFQILISLMILIDATRVLGRGETEDDTHNGGINYYYHHHSADEIYSDKIGTWLRSSGGRRNINLRDDFGGENERDVILDKRILRITQILLVMLVLEVFSIMWTFWNSEWEEDSQVSNIKNPMIQTILGHKAANKAVEDHRNSDQSDEDDAFSFFEDLVYGSCFHLYRNFDSGSGVVEYKAQKINDPTKYVIGVNMFGSLPVQIATLGSDLLAFEKSSRSETVYSFKVKDYINRAVTDNKQEMIFDRYPRYTLNANSKAKGRNLLTQEKTCSEEFKVKNIKHLKDIVNLGIINWLKLVIRFQNMYIKENKLGSSPGHEGPKIDKTDGEQSLEEQISTLLQGISGRFCMNASILELAWKVLTVFGVGEEEELEKSLGYEMMSSLLTSILDKNAFIKLVSRKKTTIPLSCLEAITVQGSLPDEVQKALFNSNINSFHRMLGAEESEMLKTSLLQRGKKFISLAQEDQKILIFSGFDHATISLPKIFHYIYNKLLSSPIKHYSKKCGSNINNLLVCISCGSILCTEYGCCNETETSTTIFSSILNSYYYCYSRETTDSKGGEEAVSSYSIPFGSGLNISLRPVPIRDHITKCGRGLSFFLHVSSSIILAFRLDLSSTRNEISNNVFNWVETEKLLLYGGRGSEFSTLYVDEYGEEDKHLIRGKPMVMCQYRWTKLQSLVEILNARRNTRLNWRSFQPFEFKQ